MLKKIMKLGVDALVAAGAVVLFMQVLLTTADVCLRYFFNAPITSSYELSEIAMGIIAPVALLYCAHKNEHVCVDILYEKLSPCAQFASRAVSNLIIILFSGLLAWQAWFQIQEVREMGVTSPILQLPMWPVACVFLICFVMFIPISLRNIAKRRNVK